MMKFIQRKTDWVNHWVWDSDDGKYSIGLTSTDLSLKGYKQNSVNIYETDVGYVENDKIFKTQAQAIEYVKKRIKELEEQENRYGFQSRNVEFKVNR
jgi:hypothetical protein